MTQTFVNDLHPWTTLLGVAAIGLCALDVAIRQGKGMYYFSILDHYHHFFRYLHVFVSNLKRLSIFVFT